MFESTAVDKKNTQKPLQINIWCDNGITPFFISTVISHIVNVHLVCIVNTCSSIDHDCKVEDYCHIAVGAHLAGEVTVERQAWIGAGATVSNHIRICTNCMIGAGAVVVKDIMESGTYIGVPAKLK